MNVMAVGAHYDDVELGCSGTLIKHAQSGDKVTIIVITDSSYSNPDGVEIRSADIAYQEGLLAAKIIGAELIRLNYSTFMVPYDESLTSLLLKHIEERKIDILYSHWTGDIHRDHYFSAKSTLMSGRHVPRVLMYRSNYHDSDQSFRGNIYSDISDVMVKKLEVIKAHKSELKRVKQQWLDFFRNQHRNDGQKIGVEYAECFEVVRYLI